MRIRVALLLFGLLYSAFYLGLASRWWFEDDPTHYAHVNTIRNPVSIFTDPAVLKHMAGGTATVPMQALTYWVDVRLAGFSPRFAHAHQVISFLLTLLLLQLLLERWLGDPIVAFAASLCWALLPATAVVLQFLATRHYLEGLLFTLLAMHLAERLRGVPLAAAAACGLIAMLYKETFAPVVPLLLAALAWKRRDLFLGASSVAVALLYGAYRWWLFGFSVAFGDMPSLGLAQYVRFLTKLPYTISSNYGGYLLVAIAAFAGCWALRRRRDGLPYLLLFLALAVVSLAAIFPVSYPLYGMIRRPDPWYRIVFVLHTIGVVFAAWCVSRLPWRTARAAVAVAALLVLAAGSLKTRALWRELTASAEREGKFYLANPGKVVLSDQEAHWFLPGLTWLYQVNPPHYVLAKDLATTRIQPSTPLWAWRDGRFRPVCTSSADDGSLRNCR